jgi:hypothetical protein
MPLQVPPHVNGIPRAPTLSSVDSSSSVAGPSLRRRKSTQMPVETKTRSLRSKKPVAVTIDSPLTSISSKVYIIMLLNTPSAVVHTRGCTQGSPKEKLSGLPQASVSANKRAVYVKVRYSYFEIIYCLVANCKVEEQDLDQNLRNGFDSDAESIPLAFTVKV